MVLIKVKRYASGRFNVDSLPFEYPNLMSPIKVFPTREELTQCDLINFSPGDLVKPAWFITSDVAMGDQGAFGIVVSVTRGCIVFVINDTWADEA
jgi:hypothetical protein